MINYHLDFACFLIFSCLSELKHSTFKVEDEANQKGKDKSKKKKKRVKKISDGEFEVKMRFVLVFNSHDFCNISSNKLASSDCQNTHKLNNVIFSKFFLKKGLL